MALGLYPRSRGPRRDDGRDLPPPGELLRELAELEERLAAAVAEPTAGPDQVLDLEAAAALFGEPANTFRQRIEYRKALISRPRERRLRYSRAVLERIRRDRLAGNGA